MSQFFNFYQQKLITHPYITNSLTTGFLFGAGDILAQSLLPSPHTIHHEQQSVSKFDYKRTLRSVIYGSCIFAFIGDKWYKFLSSNIKLPTTAPPVLTNVVKMIVDQTCFAPVGIPFYFTCLTLMEGGSWEDVKEKLRHNWWDTLKANWCVWPMFQFFNFNYVPVKFNLLSVNVFSIVWNTFLSFKNSGGSVAILDDEEHVLEKIA